MLSSAAFTVDGWPSLSVVMPSHNRREQLCKAITALQQQHYPAEQIEIIVVLDGCQDDSHTMLEDSIRAAGPRLVVIEQQASGPAAARNRGCQVATGDVIVFIDDDVVASPTLLLEHAKAHCTCDRLVVIGTMMPPPDFQRPVWIRWEEEMLLKQYDAMLAGRYRATHRQFFTGNCSLARYWFEASKGFDTSFRRAEDIEFAWRLHVLGLTFAFLPTAEAHHYAYRSYHAWRHTHYMYGRADVLMEHERGQTGRVAMLMREIRQRPPLIQWCNNFVLNRPALQNGLSHLILAVAVCLDHMKLGQTAMMALSVVANYKYWQGLHDALISPTTKAG